MRLTRREFHRLAAASAAYTALPKGFAQSPGRKLRYCIVGLGRISMGEFMPATRLTQTSVVTALVSGHPDKAHRVAQQYNVPENAIYNYQNFDTIRDNPNIDAVYIALPNGMHAEYTIRAAQAGKHVLCEKPMSNSVAEAEAMIAACRKANRKLMIAYRLHFEPQVVHAKKLIQSGAIGKVQIIESAYGFNIKPGEWRLNRKLAGGGPLMDVGIYSLNTTRFLLGENPSHIVANASVIDHDGRFNEVEESVSWSMKFPSGILAACNTSYGAQVPGRLRAHGSTGVLTIDGFNYDGIKLDWTSQGGNPPRGSDDEQEKNPDQFRREANYFAQCVFENREPEPNGEEGLRDMRYIAEIYRAAGVPHA